jgi:predicted outer membrane repeat protein
MRSLILSSTILIGLILIVPLAGAATWSVEQDGSGDFLAIGAAVAAAASGDSILVGAGTYTETLLIEKTLHLVSINGPEGTILNGQDSFRLLKYYSCGGSLLGFSLVNSLGDIAGGGGALDINYGNLTIRDCVFEGNRAVYQGGAIAAGLSTLLQIEDCRFENNFAPEHSGAVVGIQGSSITFERCTFIENTTNVFSGAIASNNSVMNAFDCLFLRNESNDVSGAIYLYQSYGQFIGNTFVANRSPGRASVVIHDSNGVVLQRNIFAQDTAGYGLQFYQCGGTHECNLYWNNAEGPLSGATLGSDEIQADPLFCGSQLDNYYLYNISPAIPENSPCGLLIGAFPEGCSTTGVEESSWSRVKSLY